MRYFCIFCSCILGLLLLLQCVTVTLSLNATQIGIMKKLPVFVPSWKNGTDPCRWHGVSCKENDFVELELSSLGLKGNIWPIVCQLPVLLKLNVSNNSLSTPSSEDIKLCTSLVALNVSLNGMSGTLPSLKSLQKLQSLDMSNNNLLGGGIGDALQNLADLRELILTHNKLNGSIPHVVGAQRLEKLDVSYNSLVGEFPQGLTRCTNLTYLDLSFNKLSGTIPENMSSLANLETLILSSNSFSGSIPKTLGALSKLIRFAANKNNLSGTIPGELLSIKGLQFLDLSYNHLAGPIPAKVLSLANLLTLDLTSNALTGEIPQNFSASLFRLRIGNNNLRGAIPSTIGKAFNLTYLEMNGNFLEGPIPEQLAECRKLQLVDFGKNQLRGSLTSVLPKLLKLQYLKLQNNHFNGSILDGLSNIRNLTYVDLSGNFISGSIPSNLFELKLQNLRLQNNKLTGIIPRNIGECTSLLELQLGSNNLTGKIPTGISNLYMLQIALNLSHNFLEGSIPATLSSLLILEILDLSNNRLTGKIPQSLTGMNSLTVLDLSNNNLTGMIPNFRNTTKVSTTGNPALFPENSGSSNGKKKKVSAGLLVGVAIAGAVFALGAVALSMLACRYFQHHENETPKVQKNHSIEGHFISPNSLHNISINFEKGVEATTDPANIVLKNKFSTYYKAVMPSGTSYSVKKLSWTDKLFKSGSYRRLEAELETQGKLNHPNIMSPLAYVIDTECAYLFYEYVHKGSLAEFLHTSGVCVLDWPSRCSIAIGIAQGLAFLHGCQQQILHLDLTTKNILLKSLSEAQIGDVELCRVVDPSKSTGSLSALAGSVGYIPPEYAYTMRVTAAGNVFSFGVILLELLTGKPPITSGMDIAKWVQSTLSGEEAWEQILDMRIRNFSLQIQNEMLSMLKIALSCINSSPDTRPKMKTVVGLLQTVRPIS
uniref:Protein kinase domain-containing protein n=1 Tax=Araucaria cunninghamii TaxID=56994 RepID=A0A0D6QWL0_ARACU